VVGLVDAWLAVWQRLSLVLSNTVSASIFDDRVAPRRKHPFTPPTHPPTTHPPHLTNQPNQTAHRSAHRYSQAGTPQLAVSTSYDAAKKTFTITTKQKTPSTQGQPDKVPVMIPIKVRWPVSL
jgi:hypothetical protein